jgi:hypothetical protein
MVSIKSASEVQVPENGSKDMRQPATLRKVETSDKWQPYAVGMKDVGARIHAKGQRQEDGDGLTERVRRILTFKKAKTAYLQMEGGIAGAKSVEGLWTRAVKAGWGAGSAGAVRVADFWHAVAADRVPSFVQELRERGHVGLANAGAELLLTKRGNCTKKCTPTKSMQ